MGFNDDHMEAARREAAQEQQEGPVMKGFAQRCQRQILFASVCLDVTPFWIPGSDDERDRDEQNDGHNQENQR